LVLLQERLQDDLSVMAEFCRTWRLIPSANKTVSSLFHLHHAASHSQLQLSIQGKSLRHDPLPVYLGVSLDRTLTYKDHIIKTAKKLKSRNNLISKLAGTNWELGRTLSGPVPLPCATRWPNTVLRSGPNLPMSIDWMFNSTIP